MSIRPVEVILLISLWCPFASKKYFVRGSWQRVRGESIPVLRCERGRRNEAGRRDTPCKISAAPRDHPGRSSCTSYGIVNRSLAFLISSSEVSVARRRWTSRRRFPAHRVKSHSNPAARQALRNVAGLIPAGCKLTEPPIEMPSLRSLLLTMTS